MARRKKGKPAQPPADQPAHQPPPCSTPPAKKKLSYDPDAVAGQERQLTVREEEVHHWVVRGKENDEVARILHANTETIRKHVENIRRKTGVESRLALLAAYWQREVDARDKIIAGYKRDSAKRAIHPRSIIHR